MARHLSVISRNSTPFYTISIVRCQKKPKLKSNPLVLPRECFKRLIIKHFDHTFDREKTRKLKSIFHGEISDRKFSNLKKIRSKIFKNPEIS